MISSAFSSSIPPFPLWSGQYFCGPEEGLELLVGPRHACVQRKDGTSAISADLYFAILGLWASAALDNAENSGKLVGPKPHFPGLYSLGVSGEVCRLSRP